MKPSKSIKAKMRGWEGCVLTAYRCPAGIWTVGYGHTGPEVKAGLKITRIEAEEWFSADLDKFAVHVERLLAGCPVSQCQFDALVSLAYNIGPGGLAKSQLLAKVKANPNDPAIRMEFAKHCKARVGGVLKQLPGLVKRRMAEADHYFGKI